MLPDIRVEAPLHAHHTRGHPPMHTESHDEPHMTSTWRPAAVYPTCNTPAVPVAGEAEAGGVSVPRQEGRGHDSDRNRGEHDSDRGVAGGEDHRSDRGVPAGPDTATFTTT